MEKDAQQKMRMTVYLDPDLLRRIKVYSATKDTNVSAYVNTLLREALNVQVENDPQIRELEVNLERLTKQLKLVK